MGYTPEQRTALAKQHRISTYELAQIEQMGLPVATNSYTDARKWWERQKNDAYRDGDRPAGGRDSSVRRMRMRADQSIEFEYDGHVLCAWHPDDTVSVEPYGSNKWGVFDRCVLPRSIAADLGTRSGKIIYLLPNSTTDMRASITLETDTGLRTVSNPEVDVVRAPTPVTLRRVGKSERWEPAHPLALKPFEWFELNKGELRKASVKYNLPEFIAAIQAALSMGADIATSKSYSKISETTVSVDGEDILTLLERGDFVGAAALVRSNKRRHYDGTKWVIDTTGLNSTDIRKIRHMAYEEMGLLYFEQAQVVTLPKFLNIQRKLADFGVPVTDRVLIL